MGIRLEEAGTRVAVEFTSSGASGRSVALPGEFRLVRDFHRFRVEGQEGERPRESLVLECSTPGSGILNLGGERFQIIWGPTMPDRCESVVELPEENLEFPLTLRSWEPGDRIQLVYGSKKLKKLFGEAKLSAEYRSRTPVLVDRHDRVLWVAGFAPSTLVQGPDESRTFLIGIRNVDTS
jgi:tRNA(Ile)-lysidine synthetase-like protein